MVSIWWLVATFVGGGCAGVLIIALMRMSGELPNKSTLIPEKDLDLDLDLNPTQW